jgi:antitoxin VapB
VIVSESAASKTVILLEPVVTDINAWFAELDRFVDVPFMEEGRGQPPVPSAKDIFV